MNALDELLALREQLRTADLSIEQISAIGALGQTLLRQLKAQGVVIPRASSKCGPKPRRKAAAA